MRNIVKVETPLTSIFGVGKYPVRLFMVGWSDALLKMLFSDSRKASCTAVNSPEKP